ncbi:hypothetical protein [Methylocaldum sp.]|uniref:hypothetical protein n=1 Tax=Methylocaldum sp. TaxID=1969727 RepID=UPI002D726C38|nr:hypothetical protein [Methylocaldum sp.]HYE35292.1 hypothetical protein [Methylocaldum sp.]
MPEIPEIPPWWGYSRDHGWVIIDRTIPPNKSDRSQEFLFFRCRDSVTFLDKRSRWAAPRYIYASTYINSLTHPESEEAALEYGKLKSRWTEFEAEIRSQYESIENERQQSEQERVRLEVAKKGIKATKARVRKAAAGGNGESQAKDE